MAKIHQSPKLPAETRREQLLRSATELFSEKGYEGTSTEEIARRAGLTKGALYFHFKSKEDMLFAIIQTMEDRHRDSIKGLVTGKLTPGRYFKTLFESMPSHGGTNGRAFIDIGAQAIRIPRLRRYMKQSHRKAVKEFCSLIDPALGYNKKQLMQMGVLTFSLFHGLCVLHFLDPQLVDVKLQTSFFEKLIECSRRDKRRPSGK